MSDGDRKTLPDDGRRAISAAAVRALFGQPPLSASKEMRALLQQTRDCGLPELYSRALALSKLSNKELLHLLSIMRAHPCSPGGPAPYAGLDGAALVGLKFTAQDKYLGALATAYFGLVGRAYALLDEKQRAEIFYRYLYLIENGLCFDPAVYEGFSAVLRSGFVELFMQRQFYANFPFLREFLVDFRGLGARLAKIGYEVPHTRELVYQLVRGEAGHACDWLIGRWGVASPYTIAEMFYRFDCVYYMKDLARSHFGAADDILACLSADMQRHTALAGDRCANRAGAADCRDAAARVAQSVLSKRRFGEAIESFNETGKLGPLAPGQLRISPRTNLRALGELVCSAKNSAALVAFAESFSFAKLDLLEALRTFLASFHLIGESQIIERIISVFVSAFLAQNDPALAADTETFDGYKSLAYSFVVLNTMLHNPLLEKKPSFDEYHRLVSAGGRDVADKDLLCAYYISIRDYEIKFPTAWTDSFDKFLLSQRLAEGPPFSCPDAQPLCAAEQPDAAASISWEAPGAALMQELGGSDNAEASEAPLLDLCGGCVLLAYRILFARSFRSYFFMEADAFARTCGLLGSGAILAEYIARHKANAPRAISACICYTGMYALTPELATDFLRLLAKAEKPKTGMLSDIRSLFVSSRSAADQSEGGTDPLERVAPAFTGVVEAFLGLSFVSRQAFNANAQTLLSALSASDFRGHAAFLRELLARLIGNNAALLDDPSFLRGELLSSAIDRRPDLLGRLDDASKLHYLSHKSSLSAADIALFRGIALYNDDGFTLLCRCADADALAHAVSIAKLPARPRSEELANTATPEFGGFAFSERYVEQLKDAQNLLRLFAASNSLLNLRVVREIHKDRCPLDDPVFADFDKLAYLLYKCNGGPERLRSYAAQILNYLSDSLILLARVFAHIYPMLAELSPEFRLTLCRIMSDRLKVLRKSGVYCCAHAGAAGTDDVSEVVRRLEADGFVKSSALPAADALQSERTESKADVLEL
ncbi:hypothetical protein PAPHI01_0117 [Pancytospora philotis]|nr:hypothetical protein PAPHI01_0117 [Pancytospora philotis]